MPYVIERKEQDKQKWFHCSTAIRPIVPSVKINIQDKCCPKMSMPNQEEEDPHTNESCVINSESASAENLPSKTTRRIPLTDISNVQENLTKRFYGKSLYLFFTI